MHQLEILSCDSLTLAHRPCEVALALLTTHFQQQVSQWEETDAFCLTRNDYYTENLQRD